jgi:hypothetical protein
LHLPLRDAAPAAVRQTLESLAALDYPALEVLVVDTHTADPARWEAAAEYCALMGPHVRFFHLGRYPGFRAGALNFALREAACDATMVGVLKAGQMVHPGWLRAAAPLLLRDSIGLAQARLLPADAVSEDDLSLPLDGLPLFRVEALRHAGGWAEGSLCPEAELGLALMRHGWDTAHLATPMGQQAPGGSADDVASRRHRRVAGTVAALRAQPGALVFSGNRSLTTVQRQGLLRAALPPLADAAALVAVMVSLLLATLALWDEEWAQPLTVVLAAGLPGLLPLTGAGIAQAWRDGRATWQGLLGGSASRADGLGMERLLVATLGLAALGLAAARPWGTSGTLSVVAMLLAQAVPGLIALGSVRRTVEPAPRRRPVI